MARDTIRALSFGLLTAGISQAAMAEDPNIDRLLAAQCAQCHGTNGHAVGDMDGLSDESYKDLYEDLMGMRSEDRPEDIMDHQALGYTPDQIRRIALYFGTRAGKSEETPETGGAGEDPPKQEEQEASGEREEEQAQSSEKKQERKKESRKERKEREKKKREKSEKDDD